MFITLQQPPNVILYTSGNDVKYGNHIAKVRLIFQSNQEAIAWCQAAVNRPPYDQCLIEQDYYDPEVVEMIVKGEFLDRGVTIQQVLKKTGILFGQNNSKL